MKSTTHRMTNEIISAIGPIFRANPNYKTIVESMAIIIARVAQSHPIKGEEKDALSLLYDLASNALDDMINNETQKENEEEPEKVELESNIIEFNQFAKRPAADDDTYGELHVEQEAKEEEYVESRSDENVDGPRAYISTESCED